MIDEYRQMIDEDFGHVLGEVGSTCTVNGQTGIPCVATPRTQGRNVDDMGVMVTASLTLTVRVAGFVTPPAPGQIVGFKGRNYRLADVQRNPDEITQVLVLISDVQ